jgi:hypothetical protein
VTISLSNRAGGNLEIYSMTGILLREEMIEKGTHTAIVGVNGLSSGVYLVRIQTGNATVNRKLIIR